MATAPVKSQPLHNFSMPTFLRWGGATASHRQHRRPSPSGDSPPPPPPPDDGEPQSCPPALGSRSGRALGSCSAPASSLALDKPQKQASGSRGERETLKINIAGTDHRSGGGNNNKSSGGDDENEEAEAEEAVQRPWNLRPRRGASNGTSRNGEPREAFPMVNPSVQQGEKKENANQPPKSARLRGFAEAASGERKEEAEEGKRRLWVSLSKEEIEEDIFAMTGSRPARRPRKRPRNVQKQLDSAFPGLWLVGITADAYRMLDSPAKVLSLPSLSVLGASAELRSGRHTSCRNDMLACPFLLSRWFSPGQKIGWSGEVMDLVTQHRDLNPRDYAVELDVRYLKQADLQKLQN